MQEVVDREERRFRKSYKHQFRPILKGVTLRSNKLEKTPDLHKTTGRGALDNYALQASSSYCQS
jgi:hypothetical protein